MNTTRTTIIGIFLIVGIPLANNLFNLNPLLPTLGFLWLFLLMPIGILMIILGVIKESEKI